MPATVRQMAQMEFTPEQKSQFRKAYAKAVKANQEQFTFEDQDVLTKFAGYLTEYWDMKKEKHHGHERRR
jgi:ribosomal protein S17E